MGNGGSAVRQDELKEGAVGAGHIVFLVIAAAAPIAAMVGVMPLGIALGNGVGYVGAYVIASVVLLLFAVGYAAMSRHVTDAGAFYTYVARGLGRPAGAAAAYVAIIAYNATAIALSASFGFFAHTVFSELFSVTLPWEAWWGIGVAIVAVFGVLRIDITAGVLAVALVLEMLVLGVFDFAVLLEHGFHGFSLKVFAPATVFGGSVGVALMYAFSSFIGFEAAALYSEETKAPERAVARATYAGLAIIGIFYTLTTWAAISAYGVDTAPTAAGEAPEAFLFTANFVEVGKFSTDVMQVLVVTSIFAGFLAFHQGASRYMYGVGRDGLLPRFLTRTNPRTGSPFLASALQTSLVVVVVGALAIAKLDPYLQVAAPALGLGTLGIILLQAGAAAATFAYFRRRQDPRLWTTAIAPVLATLGLLGSAGLAVAHFDLLTGSESSLVQALPWLYLAAIVIGLAVAWWLRTSRPRRYETIGVGARGDAAAVAAASFGTEPAAR